MYGSVIGVMIGYQSKVGHTYGDVKMVCDIHLHIEVKVKGEWLHYSRPEIKRDYDMFSKMADVRNTPEKNIEPISQPKGLPKDVTKPTFFDYRIWHSDAHSVSWLNAIEIAMLSDWVEKRLKDKYEHFENIFGYLYNGTWSGFLMYPEDRIKGLEDIRFVFWFDN